MAYTTKAKVKFILKIPDAETKYDTSLEDAISKADGIIDLYLSPYEDDLPLDVVPSMIDSISSYLAAGLHKQREMPSDLRTEWYALGIQLLEKYIQVTYLKGEFQVHKE